MLKLIVLDECLGGRCVNWVPDMVPQAIEVDSQNLLERGEPVGAHAGFFEEDAERWDGLS